MLTVKFEQMYPTREYIGSMRFDDRNKTIYELTEIVNRYVEINMWSFKDRNPSMTELRWEYEEIGQGHYITVADEVEAPITWAGQLTFEQLIDVTKRAVEIDDWQTAELTTYQLKLLQDSPHRHYSWNEIVLPVDNYTFDWMDIDDTEEEDDDNGMIPTDVDDSYDKLLVATKNSEVGFESNGQWIVNPFYDETLRDRVDPIEYYGEDKLKEWL